MQSVFVGTQTGTISSYDYIKQAYIVSSTKTQAPNFSSDHKVGIVLPTIRTETCLTVTDATLTFTLTDASAASTFEKHADADEKDFTTNSLSTLQQNQFHYLINDVNQAIMNDNTWCTNFSAAFDSSKIIQGFVYNNLGLCSLTFDNNMVSIPFIMPEYQAGGCTVSDDQWTSWISLDSGSDVYQSDKVKIAIDTKSSTIKVTGHSDFSSSYSNKVLKFKANFRLPNGSVTSFTFQVSTSPSVAPCLQPTISPPSTYTTQTTYTVGSSLAWILIPTFPVTNQSGCSSISGCPEYKATVAGNSGQMDLSFMLDFSENYGRGKKWQTSNLAHAGLYTVTVHATCGCSALTASYTVEVQSACSSETISIASSSFSSPFISYNIQNSASTVAWTNSAVTAIQTEANCGGFSWQITNQDETSPLDTSIFTFDSSQPSLRVWTSDSVKAGTYNLRVKVHRSNIATVKAQKDFTVILIDVCNTASTITVTPPAPPNDEVYNIGDPKRSLSFGAFSVSPSYCSTTLDWSVSPTPNDAHAIQVSTADSQVNIFSTDLASGMETSPTTSVPKSYDVMVFLVTENGTKLDSGGKQMQFKVDLKNPCVSATINLDNVVPATISDYQIGSQAQTIQFVFSNASDGFESLCPSSKIFEVFMSDGSTIDSSVWVFDASSSECLKTHTDDYQKAGSFTLQLRVKYDDTVYTQWQGRKDFVVKLINPCLTCTLTLTPAQFFPLTNVYNLYAPDLSLSWASTPLYTQDSGIDCGSDELVFEVRKDGAAMQAVDPSVFSVDQTEKKLSKLSTNLSSQIGVYEFQYKVKFTASGNASTWSTPTFTIEVKDPCPTATFTVPSQANPADYYYSGVLTTFSLSAFTVTPSQCAVTYTCLTKAGPTVTPAEICASNTGTNDQVTFSGTTWTYKFTDTFTYAPGQYTLEVKASTGGGASTKTHDFTFNLVNPCPTLVLTHSVSLDLSGTYTLGEATQTRTWSQTIANQIPNLPMCGDYAVEIHYDDPNDSQGIIQAASASESLFRVDLNQKSVTFPFDATLANVGSWKVYYKVYLKMYPTVKSVLSQAFTLTIIDPCASPTSLTASTLPSSVIEYTLSQAAVQTIVPPFTVLPTQCSITYTSVNFPQYWTAATRTFSFFTNDITKTLKTQPYYRDISETVRADSGDKLATLTFQWRVHNPCVNPTFNRLLAPADSTVKYEVGTAAKVVDYKVGYSVQLAVCGSIQFTVSSGLSLQISEDTAENLLKIYTADLNQVNTFQTVTVSTVLKDYPSATGMAGRDVQIKVKFVECKVEAAVVPQILNQTYQIGSTAIEVPIEAFTSAEADRCNYSWSYSVQLTKPPSDQGTIDNYMKFDASTRKLVIFSTRGVPQKLEVLLVGTLNNKQTFTSTFSVTYTQEKEIAFQVQTNLPAEFVEPLQSLTEVDFSNNQGQASQSVKIGRLSDFENDPFTVTFSGTENASFLRPSIDADGNIMVEIDSQAAKESGRNGKYTVKIEVKQVSQNGNVSNQLFSFDISLKGLQELPPALPFIQPSDGPEVNKTVAEIFKPTLKIKSVSRVGDVDILFSEPLFVPKDYSTMNETDLSVTATAFDPEMQVFMGFTWKVATFLPDRMTIKVTFENPAQIARDIHGADLLKIKVHNLGKFLSQKYRATVAEGTELTAKLSKQMTESKQVLVVQMEEQAATINESSSAVAGSSFAINILLASSLSLLWGLINSLQLITHFPLINVQLPINVVTYLGALYELATMDMIPLDYFQEQIGASVGDSDQSDEVFDAEAVLSQSTIEAGYDSVNIINGSILQWTMVSLAVSGAVSLCVMRHCCKKCDCVQKFADKVWRMIFWNFMIRTLSESFLELSIKMMIRLFAIEANSWWEIISTSYALGTLAVMLLFTLLSPVFLHCKKAQLQTQEFIMKYGSLTEQMDPRKDLQKYYYFMFTLRRFALAAIIVYLPLRPWAQIQLLCFKCSLHVIYIGLAKPFTLSWMNFVEITNEVGILLNTYFYFLYSDAFLILLKHDQMVKDDVLQEQVGWFQTGLLGLLLGFNILVMLTVQVLGIYHCLKMKILKKRHARAMMLYEGRRLLKEHIRRTEENEKHNLVPDPQTGQFRQNIYDFKVNRKRRAQRADQLESIEEVHSKDEEQSISQQSRLDSSDNSIRSDADHAAAQNLGLRQVEAVFRPKKSSIEVKIEDRAQYDGLEERLRQEQSMLLKATTTMINTRSKLPAPQVHPSQTKLLIEEEESHNKQVKLQNALIIAPVEAIPVRTQIAAKIKPNLAMADFAVNREELKVHRPKEPDSDNINALQILKDQVKEMQKEADRKYMERLNGFL